MQRGLKFMRLPSSTMPHLLSFARPLARLSPNPPISFLRTLATATPSKRLRTASPSKPTARKTTPQSYPSSPEIPSISSPLPPPSKTPDEILASGTPYLVRRTPYAQLPVYRRWRGGGTLEEVIVKKIEGDRKALANELREILGCDPTHVKINPTTTHIEVKGDHYDRTRSWLIQKGF